eukprot:4271309-Ditylum_brightwellii.AAC.3
MRVKDRIVGEGGWWRSVLVLKPEEVLKKTINTFKVKIRFTVPKKEVITPRDKFAALFFVIQQHYGKTTLEQWDADVPEQA